MQKLKVPKLTLVGAGPGDPELITLKGINAIADADVILYDALINTSLLKYAPQKAKKIFVGKRAGRDGLTQDRINTLIVECALKMGHVVRLKGGDPFVFGRGYEELEYAEMFNIEVNLVPGISSALAVPALCRIPLTMRGINESFTVITGTTSSGELSKDFYKAAETNSVLVILMGLSKIMEIGHLYTAAGRGQLPAAVIQSGSTEFQKSVFGPVSEIPKLVSENNIGSPAIIVIGETVALNPEFLKHRFSEVGV